MDLKKELSERQDYINTVLSNFLPDEEGLQETVIKALNYSINVGGKRLRPILMLESYRLFMKKYSKDKSVCEERIEPFLCAIEMIHTYSLVHDDLPAMDNDTLRRGNPTTHAKFGEAMGVLAGDALLNYSVETACKAFTDKAYSGLDFYEDIDDASWNLRVSKAMKLLYTRAGIYGMIGGQTVDVEKTGLPLSKDEVDFIYELKTCALISVSILIGAVLGGADTKDLAELEPLGYYIGMAFQIRDDILDITSTEEELGKPIGSDDKNNKTTFASIYGLEKSIETVNEYTEKAVRIASAFEGAEFLQELIKYLASRNN